MSERVISDPTVAGWELDLSTGYWMWAAGSGGGGGSYDDTEVRGLIATNASDIADLQALPHVDAYTKAESDAAFQPKGDYAAGTHTHSEYVPKSGNTTISGTLTATDMVATG